MRRVWESLNFVIWTDEHLKIDPDAGNYRFMLDQKGNLVRATGWDEAFNCPYDITAQALTKSRLLESLREYFYEVKGSVAEFEDLDV